MRAIEGIKEKRMKYLMTLYNLSDGDPEKWFDIFEIGKNVGFDNNLTKSVVNYLENAEFLSLETENIVVITYKGICEVENSLSNDVYFKQSPIESRIKIDTLVGNVTLIENMNNSNFTQTIPGNIQNNFDDSIPKIKKMIQSLNMNIDEFCLEKEKYIELQTDIRTLEAQISSNKPKKSIVEETLHSIRVILEGATGSLVASGIIVLITELLSKR